MMEIILEIHGELKTGGDDVIQRIPIKEQTVLQDPVKLQFAIQGILIQLGIGGLVHKVGNRMELVPGENFRRMWCEVPSIVIAATQADIADPGR